MGSVHSSVDDVNSGTATGSAIIDISGGAWASVRDAAKSIRSSRLGSQSVGVDLGVFLNVSNFWGVGNLIDGSRISRDLEALETVEIIRSTDSSQSRRTLRDHSGN